MEPKNNILITFTPHDKYDCFPFFLLLIITNVGFQ